MWKIIRNHLRPARKISSRIYMRLHYLWAYIPAAREYFARGIATKVPILVISFPRSGSSWLGEQLSNSRDVAYLREPINSEFLYRGGRNTLKIIDAHCPDPLFKMCASKAFSCIPQYNLNIVRKPDQWTARGLKQRKLLLKEVNPLSLDYLIHEFRPKIIFIVRHPAAIAASYFQLGWLENADVQAGWRNQGLTAFEIFGRRVGEVYLHALKQLESYPDSMVVQYENILRCEVEELTRIRIFTDLTPLNTSNSRPNTNRNVHIGSEKTNPFSTTKRDLDQEHKWRRRLSPEEISQIKTGYFNYSPSFYGADSDW